MIYEPDQEIDELRREVADLASEINDLNRLRLIRLFHKYRRVRHRLTEALLRILARILRPLRASTENGYSISPPVPTNGMSNYDVIFMSCANWKWRYQRPQHLAVQWAKHGHRVFFLSMDFSFSVNPAFRYPPKQYHACLVQPGIWEVHLAGSWDLRPRNKRMLTRELGELFPACLKLAQDWNIRCAAIIVEFPFWTPLALELREHFRWPVVYDYIDRWYGIHPQSHSVLALEDLLLKEADLIVTTAHLLQTYALTRNANVRLIPNAADVEHFSQPVSAEAPDPLTPPIIGYMGNLAPWLDVELVYTIAQNRPEWTFALIGSGTADTQRLARLKNVRLLGEIPYSDLPRHLRKFNVCLIPFKILPVTAVTDPVKLYEYLAAGKPVVATNLPELQPYGDIVYLARDAPEFEQYIELALAQDTAEQRAKRRDFARCHSWENRFYAFDQAIRDILVSKRQPNGLAKPDGPYLATVEPSTIQVVTDLTKPKKAFEELRLRGRSLTPDCVALVDENIIPTEFVSPTELRCRLPAAYYRSPGCLMVSVIDQGTWKQSNRRLLLVRSV